MEKQHVLINEFCLASYEKCFQCTKMLNNLNYVLNLQKIYSFVEFAKNLFIYFIC